MKQVWRSLFLGTLPLAIGFLASIDAVNAQVTPDGTLPTNVTSPDNSNFTINDGERAGGNLFHSFREFSVPTNGSASFNNAADVQNIISRVTGGSISSIDGLIRANGSANLFLLNPAGILFGPNAQMNIGGSFFGTTANSLLFNDGVEFSATNLQARPLLTVNIPNGLQFRDNPGSITNQSTVGLQVPSGNSLALVGGDVNLSGGKLIAPGGRVTVGGLAGTGTVGINSDRSLSFPEGVTRGNVSLTNAAQIDVTAGGGGDISIYAQKLDILGDSGICAGIGASETCGGRATEFGSVGTQAGNVTLNALAGLTIAGASRVENDVNSNAIGNGGNINISAQSLSSTEGGQISASTFSQGDAGNVTINVTDAVSFDGLDRRGKPVTAKAAGVGSTTNIITPPSAVFSIVGLGGVGQGGNINITARSLSLTEGGQLNAYIRAGVRRPNITRTGGSGNAGNVKLNIRDTVTISGFTDTEIRSGIFSELGSGGNRGPETRGNGGNIEIAAGTLSVSNGARVRVTTFGQGNAGSVKINADNVLLDGEGRNGESSGIFNQVSRDAVGNAGGIELTTNNLSITNGARITASTSSRGDAGSVKINADSVLLDGERKDGTTSAISSEVTDTGVGNAGGIELTTNKLSITNGARLNASTRGKGDAGSVKINASNSILLDGETKDGDSSGISSQVSRSAEGNGGNIEIFAPSLSLTNGGEISAQSTGNGAAGNITVTTAKDIRLDNRATIAANTVGGEGNVILNSRNLILRRNSNITTNATGNATGGNITINTDNLVAFPNENSDITANAFSGGGGKVTINTQGLLGIVPRSRAELEQSLNATDPNLLEPKNLSTSDITAISQQNPSLSGTVTLNNPDVDPSRGLVELPETVVDSTNQIAQNPCQQGLGSEFIITGRGGLPSSPNQALSSANVQVDLVQPVAQSNAVGAQALRPKRGIGEAENKTASMPASKPILPAQGWLFNDRGDVVLTAYDPSGDGSQRMRSPATCAAPR
jgi:filamentous hemagglutinin family protein